jgi:hypothetical protein
MGNRKCYYTNEGFFKRESQTFTVAEITEDETGYTPHGQSTTLGGAQVMVDELNAQLGLTRDDVLDIVASSMRAGAVAQPMAEPCAADFYARGGGTTRGDGGF